MTTELPIPSGPTNREIIDRAYQALGLGDSMFGRTSEEYASAMLSLGGMMLEWPYDQLGFIYEDAAGLRVEEESGTARKYLDTAGYGLAERLAPLIGKELSGAARKMAARLYSRLCGDVADLPESSYSAGTVRGAGHRQFSAGSAFYPET